MDMSFCESRSFWSFDNIKKFDPDK